MPNQNQQVLAVFVPYRCHTDRRNTFFAEGFASRKLHWLACAVSLNAFKISEFFFIFYFDIPIFLMFFQLHFI